MSLWEHMQLISVDDHLIEPPNVWQDRLPEKHKEVGPRIVEEEDGNQVWPYQAQRYPTLGLAAVAGKPSQEIHNDPTRDDDMIPGAYDPVARIADIDLARVQAQLLFPTFPRFAGTLFLEGADRELDRRGRPAVQPPAGRRARLRLGPIPGGAGHCNSARDAHDARRAPAPEPPTRLAFGPSAHPRDRIRSEWRLSPLTFAARSFVARTAAAPSARHELRARVRLRSLRRRGVQAGRPPSRHRAVASARSSPTQ